MKIYRELDPQKTGENIHRLMLEKNVTPAEIQRICRFTSPNAIYKWYYAKSLPSIENFVLLAQALEVAIDDIVVLQE